MTTSTSLTGTSYIDSLKASSSAATTSTTTTGDSSLGQEDFLKLLTTEMQTQDPFDPMDNTEMVAQMAQFSSVSGITEMNSSLKALVSSLSGSRYSDAASWIGKSALVESDVATPLANGAYGGQIELPSDATSVTVSFVDETGATVHSESLGAQEAGSVSYAWDGKDDAGNTVADGALQVVVTATGADGSITPTTYTWNQITGVQSPANGSDTKLITTLGLVSPEDVTSLA